jgi:hypothetical protein
MTDLLSSVIAAHGGLDRWRTVRAIDVTFNFSGGLLDIKGFPGHRRPSASADAATPQTVFQRLGDESDDRWIFTPNRVWIGRRAQGKWLPEERFRLINMIVLSLVACLFSFVPLIQDLFHLAEVTLWTVANILLSIFCAVYFVYVVPQRWRLNRSRHGRSRHGWRLSLSSRRALRSYFKHSVPLGCSWSGERARMSPDCHCC